MRTMLLPFQLEPVQNMIIHLYYHKFYYDLTMIFYMN